MSNNLDNFIGRGEERVKYILEKMYGTDHVMTQIPINCVISPEDYDSLGKEHNKHKFDLVVQTKREEWMVVEVNYKHGTIAHKKWQVYKTLVEKNPHFKTLTIDDNECKSLFSLEKDGTHKNTWQDWIDVLNALEMAGIDTV
jgi:hypothetical protein